MYLTVILFIILALSVGYVYIYKQNRRLKKTENVKIEAGSEIYVGYIGQSIFGGVVMLPAINFNPKITFKENGFEFNNWLIAPTVKKYTDICGLEKDGEKNLYIKFINGFSFNIRFINSKQRDEAYKFLNR